MYHYLSLLSIDASGNAPVWIEDDRIRAVAVGSIDKLTLVLDKGEMTFSKFFYSEKLKEILELKDKHELLGELYKLLGEESFPKYVLDFIVTNSRNIKRDVSVLKLRYVNENKRDPDYHEKLYRKRGTFGGGDLNPSAMHHIMITYNVNQEARLIYYFSSGKIKFMKNLKGRQ